MNRNVKFTKEQSYKNNFMNGIYNSWGNNGYYCFEGYPVIEIWWANWDIKLIGGKRGKVSRQNPYDYGKRKHKPYVSLEDISYLVNTSKYIKNSRLALFRVSKYSSVKGKSYITGDYVPVEDYHCHHIVPRYKNGTNDFDNLCVLSRNEHELLHNSTLEVLYELFPKNKKRVKLLVQHL